MRDKIMAFAAIAAVATAGGSACAMSAPASQGQKCAVIGADKLPAAAGDSASVCRSIEAALARHAPGAGVTIEVRVKSPSMMAASITTESGKVLPEQKFAVMDHQLTKSMIQDFAEAIAQAVARSRGN